MCRFYTSRIIEVLVGEHNTSFKVHAAQLAKLDKFKPIIEGNWADRDQLLLPDWDIVTVAHLLDWLYVGKLSILPWELNYSRLEEVLSQTIESFYPAQLKHDLSAMSMDASSKIIPGLFARLETLYHATTIYDVCFNLVRSGQADYAKSLLANAKLYALANYMLSPDLKIRTHMTVLMLLAIFKENLGKRSEAWKAAVADIVNLVQYVYANTDTLENLHEPFRFTLSSFVAITYTTWEGDDMDALIREGGDFVVDLFKRMSDHGKYTSDKLDGSVKKPLSKKRKAQDAA